MNSLKALLYFSIFKYPLSAREIYLFSAANDQNDVDHELKYLNDIGVVSKNKEFYFIGDENDSIKRRLKGNKMAEEIMDKAIKRGEFISKFPYVSGVGISGSLSKKYFDEDSDVDFFIITKNKRLWIARTLLMLYKKIFLLNSKKFFCIGYFVSENAIEIEEKNIFTATELQTLIPVCGNFDDFFEINSWALDFLPNQILSKKSIYPNIKKNGLSLLITSVLNTKIGDWMESLFLKLTLKKWQSKFRDLNIEDFKIAMKSTTNVSKHHPENFQKRVIKKLNERYQEIQNQYHIELEEEHA